MPLILCFLFATRVFAQGTAVWLAGPVDPVATEGLVDIPVEDLAPFQGWTAADARAIAALAAELDAVRPLALEFDGELEIMARLGRALSEVHVIRDEADREVLVRALLFQGFAVRRYFQDALGDDPAAEPWRVRLGESVEVGPWVDAVALEPDYLATEVDIPEEPERLVFGAVRTRVIALPRATFDLGPLPPDADATVDGRPVVPDPDGIPRAHVVAGMHRAAVWEGGAVAVRGRARLGPGDVYVLRRRPTPGELQHLATRLDGTAPSVALPEVLGRALLRAEPPVHLLVPDADGPRDYLVEGDWALLQAPPEPEPEPMPEPEPEPEPTTPVAVVEFLAAAAWVYDPTFTSTAHAGAPVVGVALALPLGPVRLAGGAEVAVPASQGGAVETEGGPIRVRIHPWIGAGPTVFPIRLTLGALTPGRLGIGLRAQFPAKGPIALGAAWVEGLGIGTEATKPAHLAWIGVTSRLGIETPSR